MLKFIPHVDFEQSVAEVLKDVYSGQAAVIEQPGKPQAIIVDFVDYLIMQAAMCYQTQPIIVDSDEALAKLDTLALSPIQERYNWVIQCYLAEIINLSRAVEMLDISWYELRMRFVQLGLPMYVGPVGLDEIQNEINVALEYTMNIHKKSLSLTAGNQLLESMIDSGYRSPLSNLDELI